MEWVLSQNIRSKKNKLIYHLDNPKVNEEHLFEPSILQNYKAGQTKPSEKFCKGITQVWTEFSNCTIDPSVSLISLNYVYVPNIPSIHADFQKEVRTTFLNHLWLSIWEIFKNSGFFFSPKRKAWNLFSRIPGREMMLEQSFEGGKRWNHQKDQKVIISLVRMESIQKVIQFQTFHGEAKWEKLLKSMLNLVAFSRLNKAIRSLNKLLKVLKMLSNRSDWKISQSKSGGNPNSK